MTADTEAPILNEIVRNLRERGIEFFVYREGRGVLGTFITVNRANGSMDYSVQPPVPRMPRPEFWTVNFKREDTLFVVGSEVITTRAYERLEVRKISDTVRHIIIEA